MLHITSTHIKVEVIDRWFFAGALCCVSVYQLFLTEANFHDLYWDLQHSCEADEEQ